jgi:hypothetical protein
MASIPSKSQWEGFHQRMRRSNWCLHWFEIRNNMSYSRTLQSSARELVTSKGLMQ